MTPDEWARRAIDAFSDGLSVSDVFRAAIAEGRAAALEDAAQIFDEKAREWEAKSKRAYEDDLTSLARMHLDAAKEERIVAACVRSLLNQGRDEVAPSPEITKEEGAPRRSPTDTEAK